MRSIRLAAVTAALVVLPAAAAWAHPSLNPDAVPVGEAVDVVLVVPHGCSTGAGVMPEEGEAVPTTRFDLQTTDGVTIEPGAVEGWDAVDDGEAIVWTDAGGATTDPIELPVTLTVVDGAPGDELLLSAYQECEDGSSYRWTEGAEGTPPVRLELTEGETGTVEVEDMGHGSEGTEGMDHTDGSQPTSDEPTSDVATSGEPTSDATPSGDATSADAEPVAAEDDGGSTGSTVAAIVAALVAIGGGAIALRRRASS